MSASTRCRLTNDTGGVCGGAGLGTHQVASSAARAAPSGERQPPAGVCRAERTYCGCSLASLVSLTWCPDDSFPLASCVCVCAATAAACRWHRPPQHTPCVGTKESWPWERCPASCVPAWRGADFRCVAARARCADQRCDQARAARLSRSLRVMRGCRRPSRHGSSTQRGLPSGCTPPRIDGHTHTTRRVTAAAAARGAPYTPANLVAASFGRRSRPSQLCMRTPRHCFCALLPSAPSMKWPSPRRCAVPSWPPCPRYVGGATCSGGVRLPQSHEGVRMVVRSCAVGRSTRGHCVTWVGASGLVRPAPRRCHARVG